MKTFSGFLLRSLPIFTSFRLLFSLNLNDFFLCVSGSKAKRMNDHRRNNAGSHFENGGGLLKSSSANSPFGHFDVGELDGCDSCENIGHRLREGKFAFN